MGINVDYETKEVEFTDAHENGVDTSLENNPSVDTATVPGVDIYSIFRRNDAIQQDGNPLIWALKDGGTREHGWWISEENRAKLTKRIADIINAFCETHPIDFTIVVPSSGGINNLIRNMVEEVLKTQDRKSVILSNAIEKMTVDEVEDELFEDGSEFSKEFDTPERLQMAWEKIRDSFNEMRSSNNGIFSYKMVRPARFRRWIGAALKLSRDDDIREMFSKLPGKNVLMIDDTVTFGNTIRSVAKLIQDTMKNIRHEAGVVEGFAPKSISALTLFSVKQKG